MQNIFHDLEEDYDPYYTRYNHGIPGSTLDINEYEDEQDKEYSGYLGMAIVPIATETIKRGN